MGCQVEHSSSSCFDVSLLPMMCFVLLVVGSASMHIACSAVVLLLDNLTVLCSRTSVAATPEQVFLQLCK